MIYFGREKERCVTLNGLLLFFLMAEGATKCLLILNGTDDGVLNTLIIYKDILALFWNPETQASGLVGCGTKSKSIRLSMFVIYCI